MRQLSALFVVAAPEGACISTSVFTEASEHEVLVALGEHLGRLANRDLAARWVRVLNIWAGPSASVR